MRIAQKQTGNGSGSPAAKATDNSWQNQSAQAVYNGQETATRAAFIDGINNSQRMSAQRQRIEGYLGFNQTQTDKFIAPASPTAHQPIQRLEQPDAEKSLQGKFASEAPAQLERQTSPKPNNSGLPDNLKNGIGALSGLSMDHVKVHYNSSQPAQLNALAYAQGSDIHVAPGQEQHLPHEAWHVVQQAQGRVKPTMQAKGTPINDDQGLEQEADTMGMKASNAGLQPSLANISTIQAALSHTQASLQATVQRVNKNVTALAARRLNQARDAINYTKATIPRAGNQTTALTAGNINPYFRLKVMRNQQPPDMYGHTYPAPPYWNFTSDAARILAGNNPADYTKAKARLAHGGNCGEHADVAYSYLRVNAVGEKIAKCSKDGLDHAFVLIGDLRTWIGDSDSEIAVADPWPTQAKATLWEDHFAYTSWHMDINQNRSMVADGQDVEPLISAGLTLTPAGQQVIAETLPVADTAHFVGNVGHLWNHRSAAAAGKEYDHLDPNGLGAGN